MQAERTAAAHPGSRAASCRHATDPRTRCLASAQAFSLLSRRANSPTTWAVRRSRWPAAPSPGGARMSASTLEARMPFFGTTGGGVPSLLDRLLGSEPTFRRRRRWVGGLVAAMVSALAVVDGRLWPGISLAFGYSVPIALGAYTFGIRLGVELSVLCVILRRICAGRAYGSWWLYAGSALMLAEYFILAVGTGVLGRAVRRLERHARLLRRMSELARGLTGLETDAALRRAVEASVRLTGADGGFVAARDAPREKPRVLAHVAHDLAAPLHVILGTTDLLAPHVEQALVERLRRQTHVLMQMTNDLIEFSRLDAPALWVRNEPVHIPELYQRVQELAAPFIGTKDVRVEVEVEPGAEWVRSDPEKLRQIVTNLATNAVKYTPRGRVVLRAARENGRVMLAVRDTGIGIPAHEQARIFEPFYRAGNGTNRESGVGLGLAVARDLARMLGTRIVVDSTERAGSTFSLELPAPEGEDRGGPDA